MTFTRGRDTPLKAWARALSLTAPIAQSPAMTLPVRLAELADKFGDRVALIGEDETLNYQALAERASRYARWAVGQGLTRGDVVCLMMHNCPDYLAAWLGITRVGAIVALINTNLIGDSLAHALRVATPRLVVVGADLAGAVADIADTMQREVRCWVRAGHFQGMASLDPELERQSPMPLSAAECAAPSTRDAALYI
ncbi:MAG TPA: AMP-binding protein, partial [Gemmatimonadaceae bacterium]|nr:AMP-binding protein [Gemmatimonadaceae bacterium]